MMDQRLDHGCGLDQSCKFPVLISLGLVQSQSFSSFVTGLPNTMSALTNTPKSALFVISGHANPLQY